MKEKEVLDATKAANALHLSLEAVAAQEALLRTKETVYSVNNEGF